MIAALFIDPRGPYPNLEGVDCWNEQRDARCYQGPYPVVAHPPCGRWCAFAKLNEKRYGQSVGSDGGCFEAALNAVRQFGGVLEHPANSLAWDRFELPKPLRGKWTEGVGGYVTEVSQSAYGHKARKRTWLYCVSREPPEPPKWSDPKGTHQIGWFDISKPVLSKKEGKLTPEEFARYLTRLAGNSR